MGNKGLTSMEYDKKSTAIGSKVIRTDKTYRDELA